MPKNLEFKTRNFRFTYEAIDNEVNVGFSVLNLDERDLAPMGDYSYGPELMQKNFNVEFLNPCYYGEEKLVDFSSYLSELKIAKTEWDLNKALMNIYWKLSFICDSYC